MSDIDPTIATLDEAIQRAEQAKSEIDTEIRGLRMARERRLHEIGFALSDALIQTGTEYVSAEAAEWRAMPRTDAVLRALYEAETRSMHRKDLWQKLIEMGRTGETLEAVSAALAYLAKEPDQRVTSLGQGWWRFGAPHANPFSDTPVGAEMAGILGASPPSRFGENFTTREQTTDFLGGAPRQ
jgi:hypothetical protein